MEEFKIIIIISVCRILFDARERVMGQARAYVFSNNILTANRIIRYEIGHMEIVILHWAHTKLIQRDAKTIFHAWFVFV